VNKPYYTYLWLREHWSRDGKWAPGTPYYVGKGKDNRAFISNGHIVRSPKDSQYILLQEFPDEASAFEGEKLLICMYGRIDNGTGCLRNLTDGGEGASGSVRVFTPEHRQHLSVALIGKHHSEETKAKIRLCHKGKPAWNRGIKTSDEVLEKLSKIRKEKAPWNKGLTGLSKRVYCKRGHKLIPENCLNRKRRTRECKVCSNLLQRKRRELWGV
jgi:hypothetical protein